MDTYLNNTDTKKLDEVFKNTGTNSEQFELMCDRIVKQYSDGLDNLMKDLYVECVQTSSPAMSTLEKYYLELSNMVYFMIEKCEKLGVYADMSEESYKEVYSRSYLNLSSNKDIAGKSKSTVAEMQSASALSSQYENVVKEIYDRAYKIVKGKVSAAQDMMNCIRKILTTRLSEMQLSSFDSNKIKTGVEYND